MKRGILIAILIIVIFIILIGLIAGFIYTQLNQEPYIADNSFLKINLKGRIEDNEDSPFSNTTTVEDLFYHIKRAKIDKRIKGIILKISYLCTGFSTTEDIGRIIKDFQKSGKKVYAFIYYGGIKEYYLATFADKVYAYKGGDLFLTGLATESIFLKNTLSKLGIKAELFHIAEYKTAANIFTQDKMTSAHRESVQKLLDDIYVSTLLGISKNRNIKLESIKKIVNESPVSNAKYLKAGLIDKIIYEDEIFKGLKTDYKITKFETYKQTSSPKPFKAKKKIALIFASGEINSGKSGGKSITGDKILGSETISKYLRIARKSPSIKAVVLRINSPGGSALASDEIRREAELLVKKKPLVISMSDVAASGGYWISISSSKILALPQTITGSIGIISGKFVLKDLYGKIGLNKEILKTSEYAAMFSDYKGFTPSEKEKLMRVMRNIYNDFLYKVAKSRNMKVTDVDNIAKGRVWSGDSALKLNLIDKIGGINEAFEEAKKLAKIPGSESVGIRIYPKKKSIMDSILGLLFNFKGAKAKIENPIKLTIEEKLIRYKQFFPAMMMPFKLIVN